MKYMNYFLLLLLVCSSCSSQTSEQTRELVYHKNSKDWYARFKGATKALKRIKHNKMQEALDHANAQGVDAEACFVKALAYAKMGREDSAMSYVYKSIELGLTYNRYQGPRDMLAPLYKLDKFQEFVHKHGELLVHGPMTGYVTSQSAKFWLRTDVAASVQIVLSTTQNFKDKVYTNIVTTNEKKECVAKLDVVNLLPQTTYYYKINLDGKELEKTYQFKTQPEEGKPAEVTVAFGGGAAYIPWHNYMWDTLNSHDLNAMLMLGDNVYIDYPKDGDIQKYCYYRRQARPNYRDFASSTSMLAIWDDHDFGNNDAFGGATIDFFPWKRPVLDVFRNQFANPYYGGGDAHPGVWFDFQLADIDFMMLDCRFYREPSYASGNEKEPQMLGPAQMEWLKEKLLASKGTFKVIVSSVPWAYGAKATMGGRYDTWRGYQKERQEIFDFLAEHKIEGVILLSADRHRSDLWKIERENGYPLYELESSKLVNTHTHDRMDDSECILSYNKKCSFGKIIFKTNVEKPYLTYEIWNIDNEKMETYQINLDELK